MEKEYPGDIPFDLFISLLQAIADVSGRTKKSGTRSNGTDRYAGQLGRWISHVRERYRLSVGTVTAFFRLFFPEEDARRRYGLREVKLGQYIADILAVSTEPNGRGRRLVCWNAEEATGCLGNEVKHIMESISVTDTSTLTIDKVDSLLTELACSCTFTDLSIRFSVPNPRPRRVVLHELYLNLSPQAAGFVTQIILRDLRPMLYPLKETHYSAALLQYTSKSITMTTKEDVIKAWDPSGRMLRAYRLKGSLEAAVEHYENPELELAPKIGLPISIPKCFKGQSCAQSLKLLHNSQQVWVETKYDGERAQIHVEIVNEVTLESKITIFSKSKRDSTLDRMAVHPIIRDALGLPHRGKETSSPAGAPKFKQNIILEAEMVAFSDVLNRIDEFWRIRSLIANTAYGVRHSPLAHPATETQQEVSLSQTSMISDASDGDTRHLALVFFDILMIDSQSLLSNTYAERRTMLESIILARHGYSMLAERQAVSLKDRAAVASVTSLESIFAKLISTHEEGAVLKAEEGRYCDRRFPWVKLKKDYIPGLGDTVDLAIVAAAWDKDRARELGVSPTTYTTFYLGALANVEAMQQSNDVLPHFEVFFTCSYLPSREKLEELNFMVRSADPVDYDKGNVPQNKDLGFTFNLYSCLQTPKVLLQSPLVVEVYGAGFSKAPRCKFYEIRFPRISKVFRPSERSPFAWGDGGSTTLDELQAYARESVGKDRPGKAEADWCKTVWGRSASCSPSVRSDRKRKQREEEWTEKLRAVDERILGRPLNKPPSGTRMPENYMDNDPENGGVARGLRPSKEFKTAVSLRPMGSVTNLSVVRPRTPPSLANPSRNETFTARTPSPGRLLGKPRGSLPDATTLEMRPSSSAQPAPMSVGSPRPDKTILQKQDIIQDAPPETAVLRSPLATQTRTVTSTRRDALSPSGNPSSAQTELSKFLQDAVVWLARPSDSPRPSWRAASHQVIPQAQRVHTLESFLSACEWTSPPSTYSCTWATKGVIFVDDRDGNKQWVQFPFHPLAQKRQELLDEVIRGTGRDGMKPVYIFSMNMLSHDTLHTAIPDVESFALCRLG